MSIAAKEDVYQEVVVAFPFIPESKGLVSRHDSLHYFAFCIHWLALGVLSHRRLYSIGTVHPLRWLLHLNKTEESRWQPQACSSICRVLPGCEQRRGNGLSCCEENYLRKVVGRVCRALLLVLFSLYIIRHDARHRQALGELCRSTSGPDARATLACLDY